MKYTEHIVKKICELIETGDYTQKELCKIVGIHENTFILWKSENNDFCDALKKSEEKRMEYFKSLARNSLVKKLTGYDYEETTTIIQNDGSGKPKIKEKKTVKKHIAPDTTAIIFTLTNSDKDNFKHKNETDITTNGKEITQPQIIVRNDDQLKKVNDFLKKE